MSIARPKHVPEKEWKYAIDRADRARKYALAMPQFVSPEDMKFLTALWQWENEVRGRFTSPVGGSLSGIRNHPV